MSVSMPHRKLPFRRLYPAWAPKTPPFRLKVELVTPAGSTTGAPIVLPAGVTSSTFNLNGGVFGAQAGYNRLNGSFLWGIETDIQWSGEKGSSNYACISTLAGTG